MLPPLPPGLPLETHQATTDRNNSPCPPSTLLAPPWRLRKGVFAHFSVAFSHISATERPRNEPKQQPIWWIEENPHPPPPNFGTLLAGIKKIFSSPDIYLIDDMLTPEECDSIISEASKKEMKVRSLNPGAKAMSPKP